MAATQINLGMSDNAAQTLDPVMEFTENDVVFFTALASAALRKGDARAGAKYLEPALALQPLQVPTLNLAILR